MRVSARKSIYLDACFRTNTRFIMRAVRENTARCDALSFLRLSFSLLSPAREGREWGARSYSPLLHPWQQHHCDGPWSRSDQCHRRAPLRFAPTVLAGRHDDSIPTDPSRSNVVSLVGHLGSRERGDIPFVPLPSVPRPFLSPQTPLSPPQGGIPRETTRGF